MKAEDVRMALRKKYHDHRRYVVAEEVGVTTGGACRRIDMIALDCFKSNGFRLDGFEIKVSTSDLRRELEDPNKHNAFFGIIDFFTLAVPQGVVAPVYHVIPKKWGILIVNDDGTTRYRRKPLALEDKIEKDVPRGFLASLVRNVQDHQPAQKAISDAFWRGRAEGEESQKRICEDLRKRARDVSEDIRRYEKMFDNLAPCGNVDKTIAEFNTFRNMNLEMTEMAVDRAIKELRGVKKAVLKIKEEDKGEK